MASSGSHAAAAARKHLRVLLPFSDDSLVTSSPSRCAFRTRTPIRGSVELTDPGILYFAAHPGRARRGDRRWGGTRRRPVRQGKVRRVEVGRDGGGAFLGRGWPEFAAACGVGAGWIVVLRHHGGGVLTVKAFDASCCLRELGTPPAGKNTALFFSWCQYLERNRKSL